MVVTHKEAKPIATCTEDMTYKVILDISGKPLKINGAPGNIQGVLTALWRIDSPSAVRNFELCEADGSCFIHAPVSPFYVSV